MTNKEFIKFIKTTTKKYKYLYDKVIIDKVLGTISVDDVFFAQEESAEILFDELNKCPKGLNEKVYLIWYLDSAGIFNT